MWKCTREGELERVCSVLVPLQVNPTASIQVVTADLANLDTLDASLSAVFAAGNAAAPSIAKAILLNNAGVLGGVETADAVSAGSFAELRRGIDLNVTSGLWTARRFVAFVKGNLASPAGSVLVNVSTLAAITPLPSMGQYCAAKAARHMYGLVVAAEQGKDGVAVLNYSPGPMETDMATDMMSAEGLLPGLKETFGKLRAEVSHGGGSSAFSIAWLD